jgi:type II secretory pathway pseudopilin PulG
MGGGVLIMDRQGFTIIEMIVAIILLTSAVLGLGASATYMLGVSSSAGVRSEALQAVESRISQIVTDPRYPQLDSIYVGEETDLPGLEDFTRMTKITHTQRQMGGRVTDYKTVMVTVSGPSLPDGVSRTIIRGRP